MIPNSLGATSVEGVAPSGGSKGGTPSAAVIGGPNNVAGPITGLKSTGHPVDSAVSWSSKPARRGRPRSGKVKVTVAVSERVANQLKQIPDGVRGQTVERAVVLVLDGPGISGLERLIDELAPLSVRLQQSLELLARSSALSVDDKVKTAALGASTIHFISKLLKA